MTAVTAAAARVVLRCGYGCCFTGRLHTVHLSGHVRLLGGGCDAQVMRRCAVP